LVRPGTPPGLAAATACGQALGNRDSLEHPIQRPVMTKEVCGNDERDD
jgi:hypothetical protein